MYARQQFHEERREVLVGAMRDMQFAALIAVGGTDPEAVHLPMIVREDGAALSLECHVAAANPFWRIAEQRPRALAIFQGPHAYVHPGWLETERGSGRRVPTWSYVVVHAHGSLSITTDRDWLRAHVEELATMNESGRDKPWALSDTPEDYIESLLGGIVGLRMEIDGLQGVWKMLQHRPEADRLSVIAGLGGSQTPGDQAMAECMRQHESERLNERENNAAKSAKD